MEVGPGRLGGSEAPGEGVRRTLGATGGARRRAGVRGQRVVARVVGGWVGAQRLRLLQAVHTADDAAAGAAAAAVSTSAARGRFEAQRGGQAVGVTRAAAGQAGVQPGATVGLAGEGRGLAVAGQRVGDVAGAWRRRRRAVVPAERPVVGEGGVF